MILSKPSCLKCAKYLTCKDPKKAPKYSCVDFKPLKVVGSILELDELALVPEESKSEDENESFLQIRNESTGERPSRKKEVNFEREMLEEPPDNTRSDDWVWQAMQKAYDPLTNSVRDLRVDDSELPLAKNYYDFCVKIAGKAIKPPFSRQLWIAYHLMGEYCPRCSDAQYEDINNVPVDMDPKDLTTKVSLLRSGICPKCKTHKSKLVLSGELTDYNQLVMVAGQRGGKSAFSSTIGGYHAHLMLKAPRLSTICRGVQDFTPITTTFVALSTTRAIKLLWNPFSQLIKSSSWFDDYFRMLDDSGQKYGKEFYKKGELYFRFFNKNLDYYPMGPLKRTLRGDTRAAAFTDELGWFPYKESVLDEEGIETDQEDDRERANGDEVHQALDNSLATVRNEIYGLYARDINTIPQALNVNISSPQSWKDKICRLLKESENPAALSLGIHLPTWEINPLYTKDHPIIRSAYAKNARRAERDFGANPPKSDESMFVKDTLQESFSGKQHFTLQYDDSNPQLTTGKLVELITKNRWEPNVLGIDAGLVNNSFALALASKVDTQVVVHAAVELIPKANRPISFPRLYKNVLLEIVKNYNVCYVGADRWNSINLLQQIEEDTDQKTKTIMLTLNNTHFDNFMELANSGSLILPATDWTFDRIESVLNYKNELVGRPIDHLYLQFMTVRKLQGTVAKGEGYTDDIFRAVVVASTMLFIPKVRDHIAKSSPTDRSGISSRATVLVSGRSGNFLR